jgi:hypothetical protein
MSRTPPMCPRGVCTYDDFWKIKIPNIWSIYIDTNPELRIDI